MELKDIPEDVLNAVRKRNIFDDDQISEMDAKQLFHEYCNWHGLINWGDRLWETMEELRELEQQ